MPGAEPTHHGNDCIFETTLRRYEIQDPVLWKLAEIIHEADIDDERFDAPAAPGASHPPLTPSRRTTEARSSKPWLRSQEMPLSSSNTLGASPAPAKSAPPTDWPGSANS